MQTATEQGKENLASNRLLRKGVVDDSRESNEEPDAGRRALAISIAIIVFGVLFLAAVLVGIGAVAARSRNAKMVKTEREAIAIATKLERDVDGIRFGEFARSRYAREIECKGWDANEIRFFAHDGVKRSQDRHPWWVVFAQYQGVVPRACQGWQIGFMRAVAVIDPVTRRVAPPSEDFATASQIRPQWLVDFRAGRSVSDTRGQTEPQVDYVGGKRSSRTTMKLGERVRIPFGPIRATGGAVHLHGVSYIGPGVGPADFAMIRATDLDREPGVEIGRPAPYEDQVPIDYQEMRPGDEWYVLVTGTPEARQTIRLTQVTVHWSPGDSFDPRTTTFAVDIAIVVT